MKNKNKKSKSSKLRNWLAVLAHFRSGAGIHSDKKKYTRKKKHKNNAKDE